MNSRSKYKCTSSR